MFQITDVDFKESLSIPLSNLIVSIISYKILYPGQSSRLIWDETFNYYVWYILHVSAFEFENWFESLGQETVVYSSLSIRSDQIRSVAQSCPILCDPMNHSTPGLPVHHQLPEFTQTHVHRVSDAVQASHPLSSPSPPAPNPFQHQSLFQWVNSSHEVAKVLEFQL